MADLEMPHGPLAFDETEVGKVKESNLGNYALGFIRSSDSAFIPKYVGRSDSDLQKELKAKLSTKSQTRTHFMFSYAGSEKAAFDKECKNYHDFKRQLENEIHPARPNGTNHACPVANCTELSSD